MDPPANHPQHRIPPRTHAHRATDCCRPTATVLCGQASSACHRDLITSYRVAKLWTWRAAPPWGQTVDGGWTTLPGCPRTAHRLSPLAHSSSRSIRQRLELADVTNSLNTPSLQAKPSMTGHGSRAPSRPNRAARGPAPQAWGERRPIGTIRTGGGSSDWGPSQPRKRRECPLRGRR